MTYQLVFTGHEVHAVAWAQVRMPQIGPWNTEPDMVLWRGRSGFPCFTRRAAISGAWCGYTIVPAAHPWARTEPDPNVHGGVTFYQHHPDTGEAMVGFDCAHAWDYMPSLAGHMSSRMLADMEYRTVAYVMAMAEALAWQAREVGAPGPMPQLEEL